MIYRFRCTDRLLNDKELEDQYFYFSCPSQQNDPMEGYINFYWKGDYIAWLGLFKHYAWQLFLSLFYLPLHCDSSESLEKSPELYLYRSEIHLKDTHLPDLRSQLEDLIETDPTILSFSDSLEITNTRLSPIEVQYVLFSVHIYIIDHAFKILAKNRFPFFEYSEEAISLINLLKDYSCIILNDCIKYLTVHSRNPDQLNTFLNSITYESSISRQQSPYISFIFYDFPRHYVEHIPELVFAKWYCVCFSENYSNPALWGYYAAGHKGVCLIFKNNTTDGIHLTSLQNKSKNSQNLFSFHQVQYNAEPIQFDFFSSLGKLWGDERTHWLKYKGKESIILQNIFNDVDSWRENTMDVDSNRYLIKSPAWSHEKEFRLVITNEWYDHEADRKYTYDFNDLDGIIFGIRTSTTEKLKIINIIKEKCKKYNRNSFNFFQAEFDAVTKSIRAIPLSIEFSRL